ncbi:hypothetical protein C0J52_03929, partial [Blattella germanica]
DRYYKDQLSTHRVQTAEINSLLQYLASQLVIQRPQDHILFLKDLLTTEGKSWNRLHIIILGPPYIEDLSLCIDGTAQEQQFAEYKHHIGCLRRMFRHILKECEVGDQDASSLPETCLKMVQVLKHAGEAMLPRVALIGQRGSGKKTQAKLLHEKFGLVVVDWKRLVDETLIREDELGETVRRTKTNRLEIFPPVALNILEDRLLRGDCQRKGWVLTGFHEGDILNKLTTPPNRIILFELDAETSKKRVTSQRINIYTGERYNIDSKLPQGKEAKQLRTHPDNILDPLYNEVHMFLNNLTRIRESCGKNLIVVDATQSIRNVFEMVCAAIMRPSPTSKSSVPDTVVSNPTLGS